MRYSYRVQFFCLGFLLLPALCYGACTEFGTSPTEPTDAAPPPVSPEKDSGPSGDAAPPPSTGDARADVATNGDARPGLSGFLVFVTDGVSGPFVNDGGADIACTQAALLAFPGRKFVAFFGLQAALRKAGSRRIWRRGGQTTPRP